MEYFHSAVPLGPRGLKIVVYTRFDCADVDPQELGVTIGRAAENLNDAGVAPPVLLELYNHTGTGTTGTPAWLRMVVEPDHSRRLTSPATGQSNQT